MATVRYCDICSNQLEGYYQAISVNSFLSEITNSEYCLSCWTKKSNWKKIHQIKKSGSKIHES